MRTSRIAAIGLAIAAGLALTACTTTSKTPAGPSAGPGNAALTAALGKIGSTSYNFDIKQRGLGGGGSVDPVAHNASIQLIGPEQGTNVNIQALQIGIGNLFAKFDAGSVIDAQVGIDPTKWMLVDLNQLTGPNAKPFDATSGDVLDVAGLMAGVNTVQQTDSTHLTGTVDLTRATGVNVPTADDLTTAGTAAKTTPFTATLDGQGRLTELNIDASGFDKDLSFDIVFSAFGAASALTAPAAADFIPAPAGLYQLLNS